MTGKQAIAIIVALDLKQAEFARLVGLSKNAVTKWVNGGPVSAPVATLLRLLEARPELVAVLKELAPR